MGDYRLPRLPLRFVTMETATRSSAPLTTTPASDRDQDDVLSTQTSPCVLVGNELAYMKVRTEIRYLSYDSVYFRYLESSGQICNFFGKLFESSSSLLYTLVVG